jgi:hypothetical protein
MHDKQMLSPLQVLSATADTILDKAVRIDVDVLYPRWWERLFMNLRLLPAKRSFDIRPATLGTMIRISQVLLDIDVTGYKTLSSALEANYHVYQAHGVKLAQIIAIAITNKEQEPTSKLVRFITENVTARELMAVTSVVFKQLDTVNFMSTIISIKGGMSLLNTGGIIASGQQSED